MTLDNLTYRAFRLRRLLILVNIPTFGLAWLIGGPVAFALACLPALHAMRYPMQYGETLAVMITALILIALAGPAPGPAAILWLPPAAFVLFFVALVPLTFWVTGGRVRPARWQTQAHSTLDAETLRERIVVAPDRLLARAACGPADADGVFDFASVFASGGVGGEAMPDTEVSARCRVVSTGPDHHEVEAVDPVGTTSITRHEFTPMPGGTKIRMTETAEMPARLAFGMWVQDFLGDSLTEEVDRAEGRPPRANKLWSDRMLALDIAALMPRPPKDPTPE